MPVLSNSSCWLHLFKTIFLVFSSTTCCFVKFHKLLVQKIHRDQMFLNYGRIFFKLQKIIYNFFNYWY